MSARLCYLGHYPGETGREDGHVLYQLIEYVVKKALADSGLKNLKKAANPDKPKLGEFLHMASVDPSAPPGRLQKFCASESEVAELRRLLHETTLKCRSDFVGIAVSNDVLAARAVPKKRQTTEDLVQPRSKRQRTSTGGTVPWVPHRFSGAWGISCFCVYVAFNRLAFNDVSQLLATDEHDPLTSSIPDLNSSDPRACDVYWSKVAAVIRATIFRGTRPHFNSINSPVSDTIPVIDPNSPAACF